MLMMMLPVMMIGAVATSGKSEDKKQEKDITPQSTESRKLLSLGKGA